MSDDDFPCGKCRGPMVEIERDSEYPHLGRAQCVACGAKCHHTIMTEAELNHYISLAEEYAKAQEGCNGA